LEAAVSENKEYILSETLANQLHFDSEIEEGTPLEFDNLKTEIRIKKIYS
jgi:isoleucyl-tRNA synthetase